MTLPGCGSELDQETHTTPEVVELALVTVATNTIPWLVIHADRGGDRLFVGDEGLSGAVIETAASVLSTAFLAKLAGILEEPLLVVLLQMLVKGILGGKEPRLASIFGVFTLEAVVVNTTRIDLACVADEGRYARLVSKTELAS